jgi:hypothetical protein
MPAHGNRPRMTQQALVALSAGILQIKPRKFSHRWTSSAYLCHGLAIAAVHAQHC